MKDKKIRTRSKAQRIKLFVKAFDNSNVTFQDVIEEYNRLRKKGMLKQHPNKVGNDIEPFVKKALNDLYLKADVPTGHSGNKKSTGYPDILFWYKDKPYYLECKTYNAENITTTQLSFYFSPSERKIPLTIGSSVGSILHFI